MGPVFRAYEPDRERLVAIKVLRLDLPPDRTHRLVAELEQLVAAGLTHSGVAAPIAVGFDGSSAYLVQEFVAADSLDTVIRDYGPAPPADTVGLAVQLAGALDFAAGVGVVGGALHPRDVLVSPDEARLTGLGVARALERVGIIAPVRRPYAAPERVAGGEWDRRADIFSLAAILYEMLWGRRVVGQGQQVADLLTELPGADLKRLRRVFGRALAEDPDERFEMALQLATGLRESFPGLKDAPRGLNDTSAGPGRRVSDEPAPLLPLEAPAPSAPSPEIDPHDFRAPELPRFRDLEPESLVTVPTLPTFPTSPSLSRSVEPPAEHDVRRPGDLLDLHAHEEGGSPLERSRSAIWPLALALVVGVALGFAGGYGVGSRDRALSSAATPSAPDGAAPRTATSAREFTEGTVSSPAAAPPRVAPKPDRDAPKPTSIDAKAKPGIGAPKPRPIDEKAEAGIGAPKPRPIDQKAEAGHLLVRSTPAGARVFIDGRDRGSTPAAIRDLTHGSHSVRVVHDGYATEERRVVVSASRLQQSMSLNLTRTRTPETALASASGSFFGSLAVESLPAGAHVFVDGRQVGNTPVLVPQLGAGSHVVRLEHDGYRRWSSSVRVVSGERNRVTASLER